MLLQTPFLLFVVTSRHVLANAQHVECGDGFTVAGSPSSNRLTRVWMAGYLNHCPGARLRIDDSSASTGAARVCGVRRDETVIDVASMTRPMNQLEATTEHGFSFQCERSTRRTIQVEIGIEGAALATGNRGAAAHCVKLLGGLSTDQLRWIFSTMTESRLVAEEDGWSSDAVPNSDRNDATRLWSELHHECAPEEISIMGFPPSAPVHQFFANEIFKAQDESIDVFRYASKANMIDLISSIDQDERALGFFNIRYTVSEAGKSAIEMLSTVPIWERYSKSFVDPSLAQFQTSNYVLTSRLYFNINNEETSLAKVRPFLEYGFSNEGTDILLGASFLPLRGWEQVVMKTRVQSATGIPIALIKDHCGPAGSEIAIAGSSTVFPVPQIWGAVYEVGCNVKVAVEGGGSSSGAHRVCGNLDKGSPVDIGDMSRAWKSDEAEESLGFLYSCLIGDQDRSAIQIPVAVDGVTIATSVGGTARQCIELLGGLTTDQLRWIYSDYSDAKLIATGWDSASLKNSDYNSQTHLWSELDSRCGYVEIRISGPDDQSGTYEYFSEIVLKDYNSGERADENRISGYFTSANDEELVRYLQDFDGAVSYFGYSYYYQNKDALFPVPISNNAGSYVIPNDKTIRDGSYNPLARKIFMNVLNDAVRLESVAPFIKFGLAAEQLVPITGYVSVSSETRDDVIIRLKEGPYGLDGPALSGPRNVKSKTLLGVAIASALILLGAIGFLVSYMYLRRNYNTETVSPKPKMRVTEEVCA